MIDAIVIPLKSWQDPQGDVVLLHSERECSVFFPCWLESAEPADYIGHLAFEHASAVRSFHREFLPYRLPKHHHHSYILTVPDSDIVREHVAYRQTHYPRSPSLPVPTHFVIVGHGIFHEQEISDGRLFGLIGDF